ncbi:hypothetical protein R2217_002443 [Cronobacter turicensis]|nr:hypothetical protein [Cronobacter turicensis]ELQ6076287.1 hypothetical protein [Cronobacter turicensis]ELQ6182658.1 hypothetical protein [Cronobacter turicensis]ELQ6233521.1 hypothetical protein [Cronobacter turicensis]ELQ6237246.1 hypothetical protein [Cronobacter turicensis]
MFNPATETGKLWTQRKLKALAPMDEWHPFDPIGLLGLFAGPGLKIIILRGDNFSIFIPQNSYG